MLAQIDSLSSRGGGWQGGQGVAGGGRGWQRVTGGGRGWQVSDHRQPQWALRVVRPVFLLPAEELSAKASQNSCSVPSDLNVLVKVDLPPGDTDMALPPCLGLCVRNQVLEHCRSSPSEVSTLAP